MSRRRSEGAPFFAPRRIAWWTSTGMKQHPDLRGAVNRALARARAARRPPTVYDLFGALIEAPDVHLMVHQTGGDTDVLASALEAAASGVPPAGRLGRMWLRLAPDPSFGRVIALASSGRGWREEVGPGHVFAAGFDAGDAALVTALERAGVSRARVRQWLSGDPEGQGPSPEPNVLMRGGFLPALARQLTWRVRPPDGASSSDAVIAACGMAALAVWLAYDRYRAGVSAVWYPAGG